MKKYFTKRYWERLKCAFHVHRLRRMRDQMLAAGRRDEAHFYSFLAACVVMEYGLARIDEL